MVAEVVTLKNASSTKATDHKEPASFKTAPEKAPPKTAEREAAPALPDDLQSSSGSCSHSDAHAFTFLCLLFSFVCHASRSAFLVTSLQYLRLGHILWLNKSAVNLDVVLIFCRGKVENVFRQPTVSFYWIALVRNETLKIK